MLRLVEGDQGPEDWGRYPLTVPQLERERENLRLALSWCTERHDAERGLRLASGSADLWTQAGPRAEGLSWLRHFLALEATELPARVRLRALRCVSVLARYLGETTAARAYLVEGLAMAQSHHDEVELIEFLSQFSAAALQDGDLEAMQEAGEQALALARGRGWGDRLGGLVAGMGTVAHLRGDRDRAATAYHEALPLPSRSGWQWAQRNLGYLSLEAGRTKEAVAHFRAALEDAWGRRLDSAVLENLTAMAALARERGQWQWAARLLGAADAGLERLGGVLPEPIGRRERKRTLAAAREQLDEPAFASAYDAGRALTLAQAVTEALQEGGDP